MAKILETRFGKPLDALAWERVLEPLDMKKTGYCPEPSAVCAATEVDPAYWTALDWHRA